MNKIIAQMSRKLGLAGASDGDTAAFAHSLGLVVSETLQQSGVVRPGADGHAILSSTYGLEQFEGSGDKLVSLMDSAKIRPDMREGCFAELAGILHSATKAGGNGAGMLGQMLKPLKAGEDEQLVSYSDLLPATMHSEYSSATTGLEHFGSNTNSIDADITTTVIVTLMKWGSSLASKLLPTISDPNPLVRFPRYEELVYDLKAGPKELFSALDLHHDPSRIANELQVIVPQATGNADITIDGFLPVNKTINLFEVSQLSGILGHGAPRHTDLVSDEVFVKRIRVGVQYDAGDVEEFDVTITPTNGRLNSLQNNPTFIRGVQLNHNFKIADGATDITGSANSSAQGAIDASAATAVVVGIGLSVTIDLTSSDVVTIANATPKLTGVGGVVVDDAVELAKLAVTISGVELDARYSEENYAKSNLIATQRVDNLVFGVPNGRAIGADRSYEESADESARARHTATLAKLSSLGRDAAAVKAIGHYMDAIVNETIYYTEDPENNPAPGRKYPTSGIVIPTVEVAQLSIFGLERFDDSKVRAAIGGRVNTVFSAVMAKVMSKSLLREQLAPNAELRLRALCSGPVLDNILSAGTKTAGDIQAIKAEGLDYAFELPNGTIVEVVTSSFNSIGNTIKVFPVIKGNATSILNFGHNRNAGTLVCSFDATPDSSAARRTMSTTREIVIPQNVVGAKIEITTAAPDMADSFLGFGVNLLG